MCTFIAGRRSSTIVAVRQFRDRDSASSTAKKAGNEADQQSTELLDKANAYVDDLKVPQLSHVFVVDFMVMKCHLQCTHWLSLQV